MRECHRVLKPGGRIAGYVIYTPRGLGHSERARALELGPPEVNGDAPPQDIARGAGLRVVKNSDVTDEFRATCKALVGARKELEKELRAEEGDEAYQEELLSKESMLRGIEEGLLRRSLVVAIKEG